MPDDSKHSISLATALRSWAEVELRKAVDAGFDPYASTAQAELERRARPCRCFVACTVSPERARQSVRECPRHEGRP